MQETTSKWVKCPHCGRKLFKVVDPKEGAELESKCPSCKKIFLIHLKEVDKR